MPDDPLIPKHEIWALSELAPELSLLAAALRAAIDAALAGDVEAARWLAGERCREWLAALLPDDAGDLTPERLQLRLIALVRGSDGRWAGRPRAPPGEKSLVRWRAETAAQSTFGAVKTE